MLSSASAAVRVEKATSELLIGPDWTMNMDICDSINTAHWQAKDVVKAVKKRLQHKNPTVQFLALTLLETLIKNCGDYVHVEVVERDILQEMSKIIRKKTDMQVRNKILVLLDSWQVAFGGSGGKYPQYYSAYIELKRSGVQFPQRSADSALIFTPPVTHPATRHPQAGYGMPSNSSLRLDEAMASEMANLSISDLDGIQSVVEVLTDMLKAVNPNDREAVKDEIITDLVSQCRFNQQRLVQLLSSTGDEELLGHGLGLNDNLQSVLAKYDALASGSPLPLETFETIPRPSTPISSVPPATSRFEDNKEEDDDDDDDDDFAQLARRNSRPQPATTQSTLADSGVFQVTPNYSHATAASGSTEASSSIARSALALPDPPAHVETVTKKQDMVDLLSITFSSSSPRTPVTPPTVSNLNGPSVSVSPSGYGYPYDPQPYILNQGHNPYNNYVAPWAESQTHPQVPQSTFSYPPPPWEIPASANPNPLPSTTYSFATSSDNQSHAPAHAPAPDAYMSVHASKPQQIDNSFGARVGNVSAAIGETQANAGLRQPIPVGNVSEAIGETQANAGLRQPIPVAAAKPFVLPNRLFDDLIELRNPDGSIRTSNTSPTFLATKDQEAIGGRERNPRA